MHKNEKHLIGQTEKGFSFLEYFFHPRQEIATIQRKYKNESSQDDCNVILQY